MTATSRGAAIRSVAVAALAVPAIALGVSAASAEDEPLTVETLPTVSDNEISGHVDNIDIPDIRGIDIPDIGTFQPAVEESGGETVVSLQTDVLFRFGESTLTSSAKDAVAQAVGELPDDAEVAVVGHTDSIGSDADNQKLSEGRAQAVADAIEAERGDLTLKVSGKGESDPVAPNESGGKDNPDGREKNRRVELRYAN